MPCEVWEPSKWWHIDYTVELAKKHKEVKKYIAHRHETLLCGNEICPKIHAIPVCIFGRFAHYYDQSLLWHCVYDNIIIPPNLEKWKKNKSRILFHICKNLISSLKMSLSPCMITSFISIFLIIIYSFLFKTGRLSQF